MDSQQSQGNVSAMEQPSRFRQSSEAARERMQQGYSQVTECVASNPASALLVSFGVGFGVGVLIGYALSEASPPPSRWYDLRTAENVGRRVLDSIAGVLPDSLSSRFST